MPRAAADAVRAEYAIEALLLGVFMLAVCGFAILLEHPSSPIRTLVPDAFVRRACMGLATGATAAALIYSPWGGRSGAHLNPAVTLAFARLGRMDRQHVVGYVGGQVVGALGGMLVAFALLRPAVATPSVNWVVTRPGPEGPLVALVAEAAMTFVLMGTVLTLSGFQATQRFAGAAVATLVALFITLEAPLSGMSLNPARTLASALVAGEFRGLWVYFIAPPAGALVAAELAWRWRGLRAAACAKLHHGPGPCIFRCQHHEPRP